MRMLMETLCQSSSLILLCLHECLTLQTERRAYATVAVGHTPAQSKPYTTGAIVLGRSLLEQGSPYPLVVLILTGDVEAQEKLDERCPNCIPVEVDPIYKEVPGAPPGWSLCWTKFRLWELDYDKIVFMDSDVLLMKPVDDLFDLPVLSASRNRCGMCCSHGHGDEYYSMGIIVLKPGRRERYALEQTLHHPTDEEFDEQKAIQSVLHVSSTLPDTDNVFPLQTLASCGCRPNSTNSTYVSGLHMVHPFQHVMPLDGQTRVYFPGVFDQDVRSVHLFNPKPWDYEDFSMLPCAQHFYTTWKAVLNRAMKASLDPAVSWLRKMAMRPSSCEARGTDTDIPQNDTEAKMLDAVKECRGGLLRESLKDAARILWSPHNPAMAGTLSIRKLLAPYLLSASNSKEHGHRSPGEEKCLRYFVDRARVRSHTLPWPPKAVGWLSYVLGSLMISLPSCRTDITCHRSEASDSISGFLIAELWWEAESIFELGRAANQWRWVSYWQVPAYFAEELTSRPVWHGEGEDWLPPGSAAARMVAALSAHWQRLLAEVQQLLAIEPDAEVPAYEFLGGKQNWRKVMLYDGEKLWTELLGEPYPQRDLHQRLCEHLSFTCSLVRPLVPGIVDPELEYVQADHEQVNFFFLNPGSRIPWHAAAQNGRLTIHVCLAGCGGSSFIQVGPKRLRWEPGEPIVFDDSFLHHVRTDATLTERRLIFHVMVMHPDIDTREKYQQVKPSFNQ